MMNEWMKYMENDPRRQTSEAKNELNRLIDHMREFGRKVDDPKARALFETSAEALIGLRKAFDDYESREPAWR